MKNKIMNFLSKCCIIKLKMMLLITLNTICFIMCIYIYLYILYIIYNNISQYSIIMTTTCVVKKHLINRFIWWWYSLSTFVLTKKFFFSIIYFLYIYIYPETTKLQSNHRFYIKNIKPAIDHSDTNYKTTRLTWSKLKTKHWEKLHTATVVCFSGNGHYNTCTHAITDL